MKTTQDCSHVCEQCKHFTRHYVRHRNEYIPIARGHCGNPRLRDKCTDTPACHRFAKRPDAHS